MRNFILGLAVVLLIALPLAATVLLFNYATTLPELWLRVLCWIGGFCGAAATYSFVGAVGEMAIFYSENHKKGEKK